MVKNTSWDLSYFYKDINDPAIDIDIQKSIEIGKAFSNKWKNNEGYLKDAKILKIALDELEEKEAKFENIQKADYYISLLSMLDEDNIEYKKLGNKITQALNIISSDTQFFQTNLSKLGYEKLIKFASEEELKDYKHFLERMADSAKYELSEVEETILRTTQKTSYYNWVSMLSNFLSVSSGKIRDEDGKIKEVPYSILLSKLFSTNKLTRDSSAKEINKILKNNLKIAENEMNSILEYDLNVLKIRKIEEPNLPRFLDDDIDPETVNRLVEVISNHFEISHRYYELKAKLIKTKKLKYHERNIPIGSVDRKFSIDESIAVVKNSLNCLTPEFEEIFQKMLDSGQIDFYPKKGKSDGAFCAYGRRNSPVFVLMNFDETIKSITTLAHEMGHAINFEYMKAQNQLNYSTPLSTAEVASTFIEDFALKEIEKTLSSDEERFLLIMEKLNDDVITIFRQIACYNFEIELHREFNAKNYLSAEEIGSMFAKRMKTYLGPYVEIDEDSKNWWVGWSHIRDFFYVYSYASGLLISKFLQRKTREENSYIEKVKKFLTAGASESPKNIFKELGVDINDSNFWESGIKEVSDLLDEAFDLARKLGKIN